MEAVLDELRFLLRSGNRPALLQAVHDEGRLDRYDLEQRLDVSRRTVTRTIESMTDRGYLRRDTDGVALTAYGSFLTECYRSLETDAGVATEYAPFLQHVPGEALGFDLRRLAGADLYVASEASPFALIDRTVDLRAETTTFREVAPGVEKKSIVQLAERVRAGESLDVEIVMTAAAARTATDHDGYADGHRTILQSPDVDIYVHEEPVAMFIGVIGDTVTLTTTRDGTPHAMVETTDETVYEWAVEQLDAYRDAAVPVGEWASAPEAST